MKSAIKSIFSRKSKFDEFSVPSMVQLIKKESEIGSTIFGPLGPGLNRQFFCVDKNTWVWHEEWMDSSAGRQTITTRYEVRGFVIIKMQGDQPPQRLEGTELANLAAAIEHYYQRVSTEVYHRLNQA